MADVGRPFRVRGRTSTFVIAGCATRRLDPPARVALLGAGATAATATVADVAAVRVLGSRLADFAGGIHELAVFAAGVAEG